MQDEIAEMSLLASADVFHAGALHWHRGETFRVPHRRVAPEIMWHLAIRVARAGTL